jgi:hypothetical protein
MMLRNPSPHFFAHNREAHGRHHGAAPQQKLKHTEPWTTTTTPTRARKQKQLFCDCILVHGLGCIDPPCGSFSVKSCETPREHGPARFFFPGRRTRSHGSSDLHRIERTQGAHVKRTGNVHLLFSLELLRGERCSSPRRVCAALEGPYRALCRLCGLAVAVWGLCSVFFVFLALFVLLPRHSELAPPGCVVRSLVGCGARRA